MAKVILTAVRPAEIDGKKYQVLTLLDENNKTKEKWVNDQFKVPMSKVVDVFASFPEEQLTADFEEREFKGKVSLKLVNLE